jgi:hypothetical protein
MEQSLGLEQQKLEPGLDQPSCLARAAIQLESTPGSPRNWPASGSMAP